MQTFLISSNFEETAKVLDYKRLGKQRAECLQILNALGGLSRGWVNHPATKMWRGFENALKEYTNTMIYEWEHRGYSNTMDPYDLEDRVITYPDWLYDDLLHDTHKSNLLRKDKSFYSQYNWDVTDDMEYYWPVD